MIFYGVIHLSGLVRKAGATAMPPPPEFIGAAASRISDGGAAEGSISDIFDGECGAIVDMTLTQPLNKGQGHSFWY